MDELLSLLDPEVSWSPVLRFLEGRVPRSAIGSCADGFAAFGSPTGVCGRRLNVSRTTALACWCWDGWSVPAGWLKGTSTFAWRGSGPSAPDASSPCRPFERSARPAGRSPPRTAGAEGRRRSRALACTGCASLARGWSRSPSPGSWPWRSASRARAAPSIRTALGLRALLRDAMRAADVPGLSFEATVGGRARWGQLGSGGARLTVGEGTLFGG